MKYSKLLIIALVCIFAMQTASYAVKPASDETLPSNKGIEDEFGLSAAQITEEAKKIGSNGEIKTVPIQADFAEKSPEKVVNAVKELAENQQPIIVNYLGRELDIKNMELRELIYVKKRVLIETIDAAAPIAITFKNLFEKDGPVVGISNNLTEIRKAIKAGEDLQ